MVGGEKWGFEGFEGWGAHNFALFFSPVPPQNSFFSSLSGGLLVEFWWCLKRRDAQMCVFGVLLVVVRAPAAWLCFGDFQWFVFFMQTRGQCELSDSFLISSSEKKKSSRWSSLAQSTQNTQKKPLRKTKIFTYN